MNCKISSGLETFIGQLLALLTFFAFPAIQYLILKKFSRKQGRPELWYLPAYGFRLVIRNMPNKRILSDLRYKTILRKIIHANSGSSVSTFQDEILINKDDFFLFPGVDQILICFKINGDKESELKFALTDKFGNTLKDISFKGFDRLISDYTANIENLLNFDIKISKRVIISAASLKEYWNILQTDNRENRFNCDKIIDIG
jgi:hypothetical protein